MEVDQGKLLFHGEAEPTVVPVVGILPPVLVPQKSIGTESILVRPLRRRGDGKRHIHDRGFEDSLGAEERNTPSLEA